MLKRDYTVRGYKQGALVFTSRSIADRAQACELARLFVRGALLAGSELDKTVHAYVFYNNACITHTYECGVNKAGKLYGRNG